MANALPSLNNGPDIPGFRVCERRSAGDEGAAAIEYALVAALISLAAIVALEVVGISLSDVFGLVADSLLGVAS